MAKCWSIRRNELLGFGSVVACNCCTRISTDQGNMEIQSSAGSNHCFLRCDVRQVWVYSTRLGVSSRCSQCSGVFSTEQALLVKQEHNDHLCASVHITHVDRVHVSNLYWRFPYCRLHNSGINQQSTFSGSNLWANAVADYVSLDCFSGCTCEQKFTTKGCIWINRCGAVLSGL